MFLTTIERVDLIDFYNSILSYKAAGNEKLPSLEEFLHITLGRKDGDPKAFDEKADKVLEDYALKKLNERKQQYGR